MSLSGLILGPTRAERRTTLVYLFARGLSFASVGYVVGTAISGTMAPRLEGGLFSAFLAIVILNTLSEFVLYSRMFPFVERGALALRLSLVARLRRLDWWAASRVGEGRLLSTLTGTVRQLSRSTFMVGRLTLNLAGLAGGFVILAAVSPLALGLVIAVLACAAVPYLLTQQEVSEAAGRAAAFDGRLADGMRALLSGFRELKLNEEKARRFLEAEVLAPGRGAEGERALMRRHLAHAITLIEVALLLTAGLCLYALPAFAGIADTVAVTAALVVALLPVVTLRDLSDFERFRAANARIASVREDLSRMRVPEAGAADGAEEERGPQERPSFESLLLEDVTCRPRGDADFALGPLTLRIGAGEIVFVTGANGSGKSVLLALVGGLLAPDGGRVILDGRPSGEAQRRALVSAVFAEGFVFDRLYGYEDTPPERMSQLLREVDLDGSVSYAGGAFRGPSLSSGQQKRLALAVALLEDRPILILDEWAGEQDAVHRAWFYDVLLPRLSASGKTIVAATHDDRYFRRADRLVRLDGGRIVP